MVLIDSTLWAGDVGDTLRAFLEAPITSLPSQEPAFNLKPVHLVRNEDLKMVQEHRNALLVGIVTDSSATQVSNETQYLNSSISPEVRESILGGEPLVIQLSNDRSWRKRQEVQFVLGASVSDLIDALIDNSADIVYAYNLATRNRMYRELFDIGRQPALEDTLMRNHGFAVNMQHDYFIATDTTGFVWIRRNLSDSWRSLFVYYTELDDPGVLTPENIIDLRNRLAYQYMRGTQDGFIEVVRRRPVVVDTINFLDRRAIEIRGLWEMMGIENGRRFQFGQGGAFLSYAFYDQHTGRMYLIDGMLFAPRYPKREFLRQLEVIAYTFRTSGDISPAS